MCPGVDYHTEAYFDFAPRIVTDPTLLRDLATTKPHITLVRTSALETTVLLV